MEFVKYQCSQKNHLNTVDSKIVAIGLHKEHVNFCTTLNREVNSIVANNQVNNIVANKEVNKEVNNILANKAKVAEWWINQTLILEDQEILIISNKTTKAVGKKLLIKVPEVWVLVWAQDLEHITEVSEKVLISLWAILISHQKVMIL